MTYTIHQLQVSPIKTNRGNQSTRIKNIAEDRYHRHSVIASAQISRETKRNSCELKKKRKDFKVSFDFFN